jgi:AMP deaminase
MNRSQQQMPTTIFSEKLENGDPPSEGYDLEYDDDQPVGDRTPTAPLDGPLPRDLQERTAFYDYASEKSLSLADSKLFYQRRQLDKRTDTDANQSWTGPLSLENAPDDAHQAAPQLLQSVNNNSASRPTGGFGTSELPFRPAEPRYGDDRRYDQSKRRPAPLYPENSYGATSRMVHPDLLSDGDRHISRSLLPAEQSPYDMGGVNGGVESSVVGLASDDIEISTELSTIYTNIQRILEKRHKYIRLSLQEPGANPKDEPSWNIYPPPPEPAWDEEANRPTGSSDAALSRITRMTTASEESGQAPRPSTRKGRKPGQDIGEDFDFSDLLPLPEESEMTFKLDEGGVFQVYENSKSAELESPILAIPTIKDFYMDLDEILQISSDGPTKSFAFRRLQYLEGKFNLYFLLNEYQEIADSKRVPHRDFYNVRKVDTHVHHSSCMNQKHLLRFIKSKMKKCPDEVVMYRDGKHLTLKEVFESINLTAYDLSIDTLDMHVSFRKGCPPLYLIR